jgi:hypothetical protein
VSGAIRIAAFAVILAIVFRGAVAVGNAIDFGGADETGFVPGVSGGHGATENHGAEAPAEDEAIDPVRGLAVAEGGLRLVLSQHELARGSDERLSFQIVDDAGDPVRDFDVEHEKRMHLIVVRRDLIGFQHLHPTMSDDGTWSTPVRIPKGGTYRVFADFTHAGEPQTLGSDLSVTGNAQLTDLPPARSSVTTENAYDVGLEAGDPGAEAPAELTFTVTRGDEPVEVDQYLAANGHLVALREGDLAFLHVHPADDGHANAGDAHDAMAFDATFPTEGRYRLFLQFKDEGRVETAAFTLEVR